MQHVPLVGSSHLVSAAFDSGTGKLQVKFKNGDVWEFDARQEDHDKLVTAQSSGAHFHKHIKPLGGKRIN